MSKVIIRNTREHDITIHHVPDVKKGQPGVKFGDAFTQPTNFTVLGGKDFHEKTKQLIPGSAVVDSETIEAARAKYPVVAQYFKIGWLYIDDDKPEGLTASEQDEKTRREQEEIEATRARVAREQAEADAAKGNK